MTKAHDNNKSNDGAAEQAPSKAEVESFFTGEPLEEYDPEQITHNIVSRMIAADTIEAAEAILSGDTGRKFVGETLTFLDAEFAPYLSSDGPVWSARCNVINVHTGEKDVFWTAARVLVTLIRKAQILGALPRTWLIAEKTTRSGQKALNFQRVER